MITYHGNNWQEATGSWYKEMRSTITKKFLTSAACLSLNYIASILINSLCNSCKGTNGERSCGREDVGDIQLLHYGSFDANQV